MHLPATAHETASTFAPPPALSFAVPGTCTALVHFPLTCDTTNACARRSGPGTTPARHAPARRPHDTASNAAYPPALSFAVPGA